MPTVSDTLRDLADWCERNAISGRLLVPTIVDNELLYLQLDKADMPPATPWQCHEHTRAEHAEMVLDGVRVTACRAARAPAPVAVSSGGDAIEGGGAS